MVISNFKNARTWIMGLCLAISGLATSHAEPSGVINTSYDYRDGNATAYFHWLNVDFSALSSVSGHPSYKTWKSPDNVTVHYVDIKLYHNSGVGKCYRIAGYTGTGLWKFWANTGTASAPVWKLFTYSNGNPEGRIWVQGSVSDGTTYLRLASINDLPGNDKARHDLQIQDMTWSTQGTQASCSAGSPLMTIINSTATVISSN